MLKPSLSLARLLSLIGSLIWLSTTAVADTDTNKTTTRSLGSDPIHATYSTTTPSTTTPQTIQCSDYQPESQQAKICENHDKKQIITRFPESLEEHTLYIMVNGSSIVITPPLTIPKGTGVMSGPGVKELTLEVIPNSHTSKSLLIMEEGSIINGISIKTHEMGFSSKDSGTTPDPEVAAELSDLRPSVISIRGARVEVSDVVISGTPHFHNLIHQKLESANDSETALRISDSTFLLNGSVNAIFAEAPTDHSGAPTSLPNVKVSSTFIEIDGQARFHQTGMTFVNTVPEIEKSTVVFGNFIPSSSAIRTALYVEGSDQALLSKNRFVSKLNQLRSNDIQVQLGTMHPDGADVYAYSNSYSWMAKEFEVAENQDVTWHTGNEIATKDLLTVANDTSHEQYLRHTTGSGGVYLVSTFETPDFVDRFNPQQFNLSSLPIIQTKNVSYPDSFSVVDVTDPETLEHLAHDGHDHGLTHKNTQCDQCSSWYEHWETWTIAGVALALNVGSFMVGRHFPRKTGEIKINAGKAYQPTASIEMPPGS